MDPLIHDLRDLDPPAPASAVDLDRVIARGLRRRAFARAGAASGATLAVLALATAAAALRPAAAPAPLGHRDCMPVPTVVRSAVPSQVPPPVGDGSGPAGSPAPGYSGPGWVPDLSPGPSAARPSEPSSAAVARLTTALRAALRPVFPGATIVRAGTCDERWSMVPSDGGYAVDLEVYDAGGLQRLSVRLAAPDHTQVVYVCDDQTTHCKPAGEMGVPMAAAYGAGFGGGAEDINAHGVFPDHTIVEIALSTYRLERDRMIVTRQGPSVDKDELKQVALDPALTLFP
ncbi:hypothetical protein [Dactylosporangium sp. NPDC048998]|uniref:hypothetical protein n=1 Tax=Dactylosporangium sp. NPDC048998 TaxID=3363976 RepID=UPI0037171ED6